MSHCSACSMRVHNLTRKKNYNLFTSIFLRHTHLIFISRNCLLTLENISHKFLFFSQTYIEIVYIIRQMKENISAGMDFYTQNNIFPFIFTLIWIKRFSVFFIYKYSVDSHWVIVGANSTWSLCDFFVLYMEKNHKDSALKYDSVIRELREYFTK